MNKFKNSKTYNSLFLPIIYCFCIILIGFGIVLYYYQQQFYSNNNKTLIYQNQIEIQKLQQNINFLINSIDKTEKQKQQENNKNINKLFVVSQKQQKITLKSSEICKFY